LALRAVLPIDDQRRGLLLLDAALAADDGRAGFPQRLERRSTARAEQQFALAQLPAVRVAIVPTLPVMSYRVTPAPEQEPPTGDVQAQLQVRLSFATA
jgi:hypothetical protein